MSDIRKLLCTMIAISLLVGITPTSVQDPANWTPIPVHTSHHSSSTIVDFTQNLLLSTVDIDYAHHVEVTMVISDNGTLFAGWKNSETHNGGGARVSFVKSSNGGETWSLPYHMPMFWEGNISRQSDPWMAWHDGALYYAYLEFTETDLSQITVAISHDYGTSWNPVQASFGEGFADKETIAVGDDGVVYVAYDDIADNNSTIRLTRSLDGGGSFEAVSVIAESDPGHVAPYLAVNSANDVYVVWTYIPETFGNLYLDVSFDRGLTFGEEEFINQDGDYAAWTTSGGRPAKITLPVIHFEQRVAQNDRMYLLWADKFNGAHDTFDVYLRYSDDYGETWSPRTLINPETQGDQWNPEMAIDSTGRLHIAYYDEQDDFYRLYYRSLVFTGPGSSIPELSTAIPIAKKNTSSIFTRPGEYFSIQLDSDDVPHVVWADGRNSEMDIFYARGTQTQQTGPSTSPTDTTSTTSTTGTTTEPSDDFWSLAEPLAITTIQIAAVSLLVVAVYVLMRRKPWLLEDQ
ncbi:MAG: sialidase family protein [Candidatus Thorarchaeota archaeon]